MFLSNKYTKWYHHLIDNAKKRTSTSGYIEIHHIIPRSLGGDDSASNLVALTGREHFIAHLLLAKATNSPQMKSALHMMLYGKIGSRYTPANSKIFELTRKLHAQVVSAYSKDTVTCLNLQTNIWARVPKAEFDSNPNIYQAHNQGITFSEETLLLREQTKFPFVVCVNGKSYDNMSNFKSDFPGLEHRQRLLKLYFGELEIAESAKYYKQSIFNKYFPIQNKRTDETFLNFVARQFEFTLKENWTNEEVRALLDKKITVPSDASKKSREARTKNRYITPLGTFECTKDLQATYAFMTADFIRSIKHDDRINKAQIRTVPFLDKTSIGKTWKDYGFQIISK